MVAGAGMVAVKMEIEQFDRYVGGTWTLTTVIQYGMSSDLSKYIRVYVS